MSISAQISISQDNATPAVAALMNRVQPDRLARIMRDPLRAFWRDRLKNYPRLPGKFAAFPSTGFGEEAADSVEAFALSDSVLLTAKKQGLRLRYEGGTIRPVNKKVLCFGITSETYGKSYAEFAGRLSTEKIKAQHTGPVKRGKKWKVETREVKRTRTDAEAKAELRKKFAFAKEITFQPNLEVVPTSDEFMEVAMAAISRSLAAPAAGGLN